VLTGELFEGFAAFNHLASVSQPLRAAGSSLARYSAVSSAVISATELFASPNSIEVIGSK
jgi:hypothetical protein